MPVITNFTQNLFSLQGELFIAKRNSISLGTEGFFAGNSPKIDVSLEVQRREHKESTSGQRQIDKIQTVTKGGKVVITLEDQQLANMKLALAASSASLSGSLSGSVYDTFASGLAVNAIVKTKFYNLSSIVVKDSAGTPATLVLDTDYKVLDAAHGLIQILNLGSYVQPFRAQYSYAATTVVPAFEAADDQEYQIYVAGLNTEAAVDQKIGVEIYRVIFDPTSALSLIHEEGGSFDLEGRILRDATKASDTNYGGFLRWAYVAANS